MRIVRYDGSPIALAYGLKTDFLRRVSLPRKRKSDSITSRRNTRNRPLRSTQKVELALALHQAGLADRVFQFGRASVLTADNAEFLSADKGDYSSLGRFGQITQSGQGPRSAVSPGCSSTSTPSVLAGCTRTWKAITSRLARYSAKRQTASFGQPGTGQYMQI